MKQNDNPIVGINLRAYRTGYAAWMGRFIKALDEGVSRYPIYRELRFAARIELEVLLDAIALDAAWRTERVDAYELVLDGDGVFAIGYGSRKADYCSCSFYIWASDVARADAAKQRLLDKAG